MGRQARRVPLNFDWPIGQVWEGYLTPSSLHEDPCPDCRTGLTPDGDLINGIAYMIVGLGDDLAEQQRGRAMHPWLKPLYEISYVGGHKRPTARFEEFIHGLHPEGRGPDMFGRNPYGLAYRLVELAGLDEQWMRCPTCDGEGSLEAYPGQRAEAEAWEPTQPPTGDGWQMWESTSEGSPQTPVFATVEALARHCADTGASLFGSHTAPYEQWLAIFVGEDFAHIQIAPGVVMM